MRAYGAKVPPSRSRMPRWLVVVKAALALALLTGAVFPDVGGFAGKGMAFRLPLFLAPALIVPVVVRVRRRGGTYPWALDAAVTIPFLLDTLGNAVGLYDAVEATDDVLHALNWFVLVGGITWQIRRTGGGAESLPILVGVAGAGIGALAIIGWEVAEYGVMQLGVAGLQLTYGDTLGDLVLSSVGGALGAWAALAILAQSARSRSAALG